MIFTVGTRQTGSDGELRLAKEPTWELPYHLSSTCIGDILQSPFPNPNSRVLPILLMTNYLDNQWE